ncbi:MAG: hypothetical protein GF409_04440 [Candidatus Omnitrophica bacterium]|nr:hypothetical protein [Candidatus Omnitrophota bacterium]
MVLAEIVNSCVNLFFPETCALCAKHSADYPLPICPDCAGDLNDHFLPPASGSGPLENILSCGPYAGSLRLCIKKFKYNGRLKVTPLFGGMISSCLEKYGVLLKDSDCLIPVPLHPAKRRKRGYNQSELIAHILQQELSVPSHKHILVKTRNTGAQTGLPRNERVRNLAGSFRVIDKDLVAGRNVVLVDDIITTGATLETCARQLVQAGAGKVSGFTLARTPRKQISFSGV